MDSLTKEEIAAFTEEHLDVEYYLEDTDDFVVKAFVSFLESHRLNPILKHKFVFSTDNEFMIEPLEYDIHWQPEVVLGANSFNYEKVYIGIRLRSEEGTMNLRVASFVPELGYGLIK